MKQWYALYVFLYSYEFVKWADCLVGHSCPESGPLSLTCSITTTLGNLLMIDTLHICSYWYIFPSKCAWKACFPILLAQGEIPASGSIHPSCCSPAHPPPPHPHHPARKQNRTGVTRLSTCTKRGGI